jgi:hypothetical protein
MGNVFAHVAFSQEHQQGETYSGIGLDDWYPGKQLRNIYQYTDRCFCHLTVPDCTETYVLTVFTQIVTFQVPIVASMKTTAFWDIVLYSLTEVG